MRLSLFMRRQPSLSPIRMSDAQLPESNSLRLLGLTLTADLRWNKYIESIASSTARKVGSLSRARKFFSPESILQIYKSTIRPCMEYCCHIWSGAPSVCLGVLDRLQRRICNIVGPALASRLQSLFHRRAVTSLCLFYKYFHGNCSEELHSLVPRRHEFQRLTRLASRSHLFTVETPKCSRLFYSNSFMSRTSRLWNSLPYSCFPESYNLQLFKCNVNRHLQLP